ncbi:hypothetical protein GCM10023238_24680 [Streptomyces heliomycini]
MQDGDERFGWSGDAAHEVQIAGWGRVEDADEEVRGAGEGGAAQVLAARGAGAETGEDLGRVLPGGLAYGLVDEAGQESARGGRPS